jgi:hypothetical protein
VFSVTIPGQTNGALVAFFVRAVDSFGVGNATATFPDNAPTRECLIRFGETQPIGTFGTYRFWLTQSNFNTWVNRPEKLSNEPLDGTFVAGNFRVIHQAGARYAGSPFHSPGFTSPIGANCDYQITLPPDDAHLAETEFTLQLPGNGGGDSTGQGQQTAYWFARRLGIPFNHHRYVNMFMQGVRRGIIMEDVQQPNGDHARQWFPDVDDGDLYKIQIWFEFNDTSFSPFGSTGASLANFTSGGAKKLARYRQNWGKRSVRDSASNYTNLFRLVDTLNIGTTGDAYLATVGPVIDFNEWSRVFAVERLIGNGDSYGNGGGQNMYIFKAGAVGPWHLLLWDIDFAFFSASATSGMFTFSDTPVTTLFNHPFVRRTYWQALIDAASNPLLPANINPMVDAKYDAFRRSGINATAPTAIKTYATTRRDHLLALLSTVRADLTIANNGGVNFTNASTVITLSGTAPLDVRALTVNGIPFPECPGTRISNWSNPPDPHRAHNLFVVEGRDAAGSSWPARTRSITVYFNARVARPEDSLTINEILFRPATNNASYVEISTASTNNHVRLVELPISRASTFGVQGRDVARAARLTWWSVQDRAAFQVRLRHNAAIAGEFAGSLDPDGETLTLVRTVGTTSS